MQFEAILSDLNFQKWETKKQTWQRLRSFKQDCLSLKNQNAKFIGEKLKTKHTT